MKNLNLVTYVEKFGVVTYAKETIKGKEHIIEFHIGNIPFILHVFNKMYLIKNTTRYLYVATSINTNTFSSDWCQSEEEAFSKLLAALEDAGRLNQ